MSVSAPGGDLAGYFHTGEGSRVIVKAQEDEGGQSQAGVQQKQSWM